MAIKVSPSIKELIDNILSAKDCKQTLQLSESAGYPEAKAQYRRIALLLHPDKNPSSLACAAFQKAASALQSLRDKADGRQV